MAGGRDFRATRAGGLVLLLAVLGGCTIQPVINLPPPPLYYEYYEPLPAHHIPPYPPNERRYPMGVQPENAIR